MTARVPGGLWAVILLLVGLATAAPAADVGIVLMHGKWGTADPRTGIGQLRGRLEQAGFAVATPDMPWHRNRYLAKGYEDSMAEIDGAVADLRRRGATRIVVGGHSMGANAALGYGARRPGLAGILAIAPGHVPDLTNYARLFVDDVAKAKAMVAEGRGDATAAFTDVNQGERKTVEVRAADYLSWFDPDGPAGMKGNAARLGAPLLWIIGREDRLTAAGEGYAFSSAPTHPNNRYLVIGGGHGDTPVVGADDIIAWLKGL